MPFFRVILKPSFSILKTERSFFLIRAMSSLMSLSSKAFVGFGLASSAEKAGETRRYEYGRSRAMVERQILGILTDVASWTTPLTK